MWPWRGARPAASEVARRPTGGDAASDPGWRGLPPIQRTIGTLAPTAPREELTDALSSWRNPSLLAPLGHLVSPDAPCGVIHGLVEPAATPIEYSVPGPPLSFASPPAASSPLGSPAERPRRATGVVQRMVTLFSGAQRSAEPGPPGSDDASPGDLTPARPVAELAPAGGSADAPGRTPEAAPPVLQRLADPAEHPVPGLPLPLGSPVERPRAVTSVVQRMLAVFSGAQRSAERAMPRSDDVSPGDLTPARPMPQPQLSAGSVVEAPTLGAVPVLSTASPEMPVATPGEPVDALERKPAPMLQRRAESTEHPVLVLTKRPAELRSVDLPSVVRTPAELPSTGSPHPTRPPAVQPLTTAPSPDLPTLELAALPAEHEQPQAEPDGDSVAPPAASETAAPTVGAVAALSTGGWESSAEVPGGSAADPGRVSPSVAQRTVGGTPAASGPARRRLGLGPPLAPDSVLLQRATSVPPTWTPDGPPAPPMADGTAGGDISRPKGPRAPLVGDASTVGDTSTSGDALTEFPQQVPAVAARSAHHDARLPVLRVLGAEPPAGREPAGPAPLSTSEGGHQLVVARLVGDRTPPLLATADPVSGPADGGAGRGPDSPWEVTRLRTEEVHPIPARHPIPVRLGVGGGAAVSAPVQRADGNPVRYRTPSARLVDTGSVEVRLALSPADPALPPADPALPQPAVQMQTAAAGTVPPADATDEPDDSPVAPEPVQRAVEQAAPATGAAGGTAAAGHDEPDEMVKKLFDPLLRRLKAELRLDRERRGMLTDLRH